MISLGSAFRPWAEESQTTSIVASLRGAANSDQMANLSKSAFLTCCNMRTATQCHTCHPHTGVALVFVVLCKHLLRDPRC